MNTFPKYELVQRIHRGGGTEVWRAYRKSLELPVVLKVFVPHEEWDEVAYLDWRALFLNEADVLCRLQHPSIVRFYDLEESGDESMAIVLESGRHSLEQVLLEPEEAGMIAVKILSAIQYLQRPLQIGQRSYGVVVHGDIKPANIIVSNDGVRLIDFGFSCPDPGLNHRSILGSPLFLSTSRAHGAVPSWKDDGYALAVTLLTRMGQDPSRRSLILTRVPVVSRCLWRLMDGEYSTPGEAIEKFAKTVGDHNYGPALAQLRESSIRPTSASTLA